MIQRIQSVFLLLMAITMMMMLFFPIWVKGDPEGEMVILNAFNLSFEDHSGLIKEVISQKSVIYISIFALISAAISLYSIFQYKNRLTQMKLGLLNSVVGILVVGGAFYAMTKGKAMVSPDDVENFKLGFMLPVIALLFNSMANRFIRKDEKLVKDSERMR
jgi:glucan phosphoethanolaminetransferase (alkaline phosphatase superfamily)